MSQQGHDYDKVAQVYFPVALVVFGIVVAVLLLVIVRDGVLGKGKPTSRAIEAKKLELVYAGALVVVAGLLGALTLDHTSRTVASQGVEGQPSGPRPALTVDVTAAQWNWAFAYPGGVVTNGNGRKQRPVLVVPEHETVRFNLRSRDVVHAFWIPTLRVKYDAYPDRTNTFDVTFAKGRDYSTSRCSEFCGTYHDQMRFNVRVLTRGGFRAWLRGRQT